MKEKISIGSESETLEFKKSTGELKEGLISISSMLNKHGQGTVYFGVDNDGTVLGQQVSEKTLREISNEIGQHIAPQISPKISIESIGNKTIAVVEVEGHNRPYSAYERYYLRSADEDRTLAPSQLQELVRANYDAIFEIESTRPNLTFAQLRMLYSSEGLSINEKEFERNIGLRNEHGEYNMMAELLADKNDTSIKVATFDGEDKAKLIEMNEYGGQCLIIAMKQAMDYVDAINKTTVFLDTRPRTEISLFDKESFHEAWINACLHTKWEMMNPPAIYIYSNRIEVVSTGGLPFGMSKKEFYDGISRPVNPRLQRIFGQLRLVEQTGHGVQLITDRYGRKAFGLTNLSVKVTIPFREEMVLRQAKREMVATNEAESTILGIVAEAPNITIEQMAEKSGFSNSYVRKLLDSLRKKNLLERDGSNKTGSWILK